MKEDHQQEACIVVDSRMMIEKRSGKVVMGIQDNHRKILDVQRAQRSPRSSQWWTVANLKAAAQLRRWLFLVRTENDASTVIRVVDMAQR
jgi:hypothetical protein